MAALDVKPSFDAIQTILATYKNNPKPPNIIPICATIPCEIHPIQAYLRVSKEYNAKRSFLFESAINSETIGRYSFVGSNPRKVLKTGSGHGPECDPLPILEKELAQYCEAVVPGLELPPLTGGAIGYVGYDCVHYFEPKTARKMKDVLQVPESFFMFFDTIIAFDHFFQVVKVITYIKIPNSLADIASLASSYEDARRELVEKVSTLQSSEILLPPQSPIAPNQTGKSNIGQAGYEAHVLELKKEIERGNIIQAVPSHRISRPTTLHPFNIYRKLRTTNPSPYLFYINCSDFQLVGASPELLVKREPDTHRIITHPIAGTIRRGSTRAEDIELANELRSSAKDRSEHVMLVDLARNDINRVCDPLSTRVDRLMVVEKFSHVQHLVSQVSGCLRQGKTRFDAFRSIFPAGTVSGAPKVRAMELIAELEQEKRGVYAGAVGYFGYGNVDSQGKETEGAMDTCIALRSMLVKDKVAYLQAGGGIVYDSVPKEEWEETMNKLASNIRCIDAAEASHTGEEISGKGQPRPEVECKVHVDLAAG